MSVGFACVSGLCVRLLQLLLYDGTTLQLTHCLYMIAVSPVVTSFFFFAKQQEINLFFCSIPCYYTLCAGTSIAAFGCDENSLSHSSN